MDELGLGGVEDGDDLFQLGEEEGGAAADEVRDTVAGDQLAAVGRGIYSADEPFFVADFDAGSGGELIVHGFRSNWLILLKIRQPRKGLI